MVPAAKEIFERVEPNEVQRPGDLPRIERSSTGGDTAKMPVTSERPCCKLCSICGNTGRTGYAKLQGWFALGTHLPIARRCFMKFILASLMLFTTSSVAWCTETPEG